MKVIEVSKYKIYYSDSLESIVIETIKILDKKIMSIKMKEYFHLDLMMNIRHALNYLII